MKVIIIFIFVKEMVCAIFCGFAERLAGSNADRADKLNAHQPCLRFSFLRSAKPQQKNACRLISHGEKRLAGAATKNAVLCELRSLVI